MGPVIPAASSLYQLEENAAASKLDLSADDRAQIESVFA
jgi:aryl-alcohol dehydrogenase-like predicted oxidoreductase